MPENQPNTEVCESTKDFVRKDPWSAVQMKNVADLKPKDIKREQSDAPPSQK
jgi:hypothetical protein